MIKYKTGDIFTSEAEALVNTVNCVGVMGRGIALQFKNKYPQNFKIYQQACKNKLVKPGEMFVFSNQQLIFPRWIINFPTKRHWRGKSHIEDIELGLQDLVQVIQQNQIRSIAIPPLGAGLGGLNWHDVRNLIEKYLIHLDDVLIEIYEPNHMIERMTQASTTPKMTIGRATLIELMQRYLDGLLDTSISLLEVHKLMYFMQEAGEKLNLNYVKDAYGPYAENLRHVLKAIEGHFILGYADGGDNPQKQLTIIPNILPEAKKMLTEHTSSHKNFERVTQLVDGFETAFGLELLATVHWLVQHENIAKENLVNAVYQWNSHKKIFSPQQIYIAYHHLQQLKWI